MSWSRRRVLAGLGLGLGLGPGLGSGLGCSSQGTERRPPRTPSSIEVRLPAIVKGELPSGMGLYLVEDHGVPLVAMAVAVAAGQRRERPGQEGWASVATQLLLEGMEGGDRAAQLDRYGELGTTPRASVGPSQVVLGCTVHRDDAAAALRLLLDNLRTPTAAAPAFERVVREHRESLQAARGVPATVAGLGLMLASHGVDPPAAALSGGTPRSLAALTLESARGWLAPWLRPDAMTLLVAGDVREPDAVRWASAATEGWPRATGALPPEPPAPPVIPGYQRPQAVLVRWPALPQAIVALGGPRNPRKPAQNLAESLMAGMMQYELRSRQRVSYGVQTRMWSTRLGPVGQLWAKVEPRQADSNLRRILAYLERLQSDVQLREDAVAEVRRAAMLGLMHDFHGAERGLGQLRRLVEAGMGSDAPAEELKWLRGLDTRRVTLALQRIYRRDRVRLCVLGDDTVVERARAALSGERVVERTPAELLGLDAAPVLVPPEVPPETPPEVPPETLPEVPPEVPPETLPETPPAVD